MLVIVLVIVIVIVLVLLIPSKDDDRDNETDNDYDYENENENDSEGSNPFRRPYRFSSGEGEPVSWTCTVLARRMLVRPAATAVQPSQLK